MCLKGEQEGRRSGEEVANLEKWGVWMISDRGSGLSLTNLTSIYY